MTSTTYYNLNIVEGTDIVNPLVVDNPNYEKIDEVMHNNAVAGVTLATEITNATVHAITRENSDCAVIRFIATSKWKAGDTATVDGVPVTALLPSGETLPDGAYVINANVLCILTGTNLTVYLGSKKVENANEIPFNDTTVGAELVKLDREIVSQDGKIVKLNGEIVNLNGEIDNVNSNLQWKLLSTVTGTKEVSLPVNYTELFILVTPTATEQFIFNIPKIALDTKSQVFSSGNGIYASGYYLYQIQISVSTTKAVLTKSRYSENSSTINCMSTSTMRVYYR